MPRIDHASKDRLFLYRSIIPKLLGEVLWTTQISVLYTVV